MEVSQVVLEWQAQALARGLALGRDEGRAEERAEMLNLLREKLLRLLRKKSSTELPADMVAVVQGQNDPVLLGQWFDRALDASSLEEARTGLGLS